ncbi:hypothetical protein BASA60_000518 [Batrachochytrium salamandrivorans]|nr:hypothetical protein BASA60_000518 [Batrachochytrium salamandrivorans]
MSLSLYHTAAIAAASLSLAAAHGFMAHPGPVSGAFSQHAVRNYDAISTNIDSLRNPIDSSSPICRGAAKAFSIGAQHIGPCAVEILDENLSNPVQIAQVSGPNGCAVKPLAQFRTDKSSPASAQCPKHIPSKLVTDDMCLNEWTFTVTNVEKIKCTQCVLRWTWSGEHISVNNPELYETCADVIISGGGGGGGGDPSVPPPAPTRTATTTRRNKSTLQPTTDTATSVGESTSTRPPSPSSTTTRKGPKRRKSRKPKTATATTFSPTAEETAVYGTPKGGPKSCGLVAGFAECGKGNANGGPQMACTSDRTGFFACYAGESARAPIRMSCAPGTVCEQSGDEINCVAA